MLHQTRRQFLAWTVSVAAASALTTACRPLLGSSSGPTKIILMRWGNPEELKVTKEGLQKFSAQHPQIQVDFQHVPTNYYDKLKTMLAGGVGPDVFIIGAAYATDYAARRVSADLTPLVQRDKFDLSDFIPAGVNQYRWRGGLYGLPRGLGRSGLVFNRQIFKDAGVADPPHDWRASNWTYQDFVDIGNQLTKPAGNGQPPQYAFAINPGNLRLWLTFVWSNGGEVFNVDGTECLLTQPASIEALQYLQDLIHKHHVAPRPDALQEQNVMSLFATGRVAIDFTEPFTFATRRREAKFHWDCAVTPSGAKGRVPGGGGAGWDLSAGSQQRDAAWELFKMLTSKDFQTAEQEQHTTTTPRISITNSPAFLDFTLSDGTPVDMRVYADNVQIMRPDPQLLRWDEVINTLNRELGYLWDGTRPAKAVAQSAKKAVDPLLKAEGT